MTTPDALLPCPFCGGSAKHYHRPDTTGWSNTDWVSCSDDDCGVSTALEEAKAGAIATWNRRAGQAHAYSALLATLEDVLYQAETRIKDGKEMGASVWRIALEDIVREARAAIAAAKGA
jgi:Lar family restriction alleviation protein